MNKLAFVLAKKSHIVAKLIVMESEGDLSDNAFALFEYMNENGYLEKWKICWLVDHPFKCKKRKYKNTIYVKKRPIFIDLKRTYYLSKCKYYIYDHNDMLSPLGKKEEQICVYLTHGFSGYKASKDPRNGGFPDNFSDYFILQGELSEQLLPLHFNMPNGKMAQLGFPRQDYFFKDLSFAKKIMDENYGLDKYEKKILWMPTFRTSTTLGLDEGYFKNETGIPLVETRNKFNELNDFLNQNNIIVIIKTHHLQRKMEFYKSNYSNILFISDEDLKILGLQLYQFIPITDALITDYSSVSADYMLLDKPIIYVLDDYEEFKASRGIVPDNVLDLWAGDHVYDLDGLKRSILDVSLGMDNMKKERNALMPQYYKYRDGNASKRILDYFKITV